jgi:hypothetical protein
MNPPYSKPKGSSDRDQLHVAAGNQGKISKVFGIRREDLIAVVSEEDDGGIDDVGAPGAAQKDSGSSAQVVIDRTDVDAG